MSSPLPPNKLYSSTILLVINTNKFPASKHEVKTNPFTNLSRIQQKMQGYCAHRVGKAGVNHTTLPTPFPSVLLNLHFNLQHFFLHSGRMGVFTVKTRETKMNSCQVANSAYSLARFRCFLYRGGICIY